jgi:hypothetical protein
MTTPTLKLVMNRHNLVLPNIIRDMQPRSITTVELCVQLIRNHLVSSTLEWEEFTRIVITETDVVRHFDTSSYRFQQRWNQGLGIQIRCLNEDALLCISEPGEPGFILWRVDAGMIWCAPGLAVDESYWEGLVDRVGDVGCHFLIWSAFWCCASAVLMCRSVQVLGDELHA